MAFVHSFAPLCNPSARCLVLGSMPGKASLAAGRYYAHPRNLFWPIMGALVGAHPELPYEERVACLNAAGIAVWDVLKSCHRESSLDSDIDDSTIIPNDFPAFFSEHPYIQAVFFNGAKAEASFLSYVKPSLEAARATKMTNKAEELPPLHLQRLPSTSPAHAAMTFEKKLQAWQAILAFLPARKKEEPKNSLRLL